MVRRTTWILLGVFAAAALLYFGGIRLAAGSPEATPTELPGSPWSLLAEQVESIRVTDLSASDLVVVKRDPTEGWRMLAPALSAAEAGRIEAALASALAPTVRQTLAAGADLGPYGLDPARFRLTLLMVDGTSRSIDVGDLDPTGSVYYARLPGEGRILMVSRFSLEDLLTLVAVPPYPVPTETPGADPGLTPVP